jgi:hypothetical protein
LEIFVFISLLKDVKIWETRRHPHDELFSTILMCPTLTKGVNG